MNNSLKKRVDDLGRIVIPKPIRDDLKIKTNDEVNIFVNNESIVLKKNIGLINYKNKFDNFLKLLKYNNILDLVIVEDNKVISSSDYNINFNEHIVINYNEFIKNREIQEVCLKDNYIKNIYVTSIIVDSIFLGYLIYIVKDKSMEVLNNIKIIDKVILNLID